MASLFTVSGKSRLVVLAILWVLVALMVSLLLEPEPPEPTGSTMHGNNTWELPAAQDFTTLEKAWETTRALKIFYQEDVSGNATSTQQEMSPLGPGKTPWRLHGVIRVDNQQFALIESGGRVARIPAKGTLPNGEVLRRIYSDRIEIQDGKTRSVVELYKWSPEN